jgi:hypothetical protein
MMYNLACLVPAFVLSAAALFGVGVSPAAVTETSNLGGSIDLTATYQVNADFSWASRAVSVQTTASVRNTSGGSVNSLDFNLTPLVLGNAHVSSVLVNGSSATKSISDQTLVISLPSTLAAGASVSVEIDYTATLNSNSKGVRWLFARTTELTAYRWIPWLSRPISFEANRQGDPWVTPLSPRVDVTIKTDRKLKIASTGQRVSTSGNGLIQSFVATNVRDFNFTAAPNYRVSSRTVSIAGGASVKVKLYYRYLPSRKVLNWVARALRDYSAKVAPYAYPVLNIGEVDRHAAPIESPEHFWIPVDTSSRLLPWTVTHETGHQWFYAVVGNDQVTQPFADEAVVDFMARNLTDTWAKSPSRCGTQDLDRSISYYGSCYAWVIYVQGNLYLRDYYNYVGAADFWAGLHDYFTAYRWQFGGTRQLLDSLDAAAGVNYPFYKRFPTLY